MCVFNNITIVYFCLGMFLVTVVRLILVLSLENSWEVRLWEDFEIIV